MTRCVFELSPLFAPHGFITSHSARRMRMNFEMACISKSGSTMRSSSIFSKNSRTRHRLCQLLKRKYTVLHDPYSFGRARHGDPVRSIQCTTLRKFLTSPVDLPPQEEIFLSAIWAPPDCARDVQGSHSSTFPQRNAMKIFTTFLSTF